MEFIIPSLFCGRIKQDRSDVMPAGFTHYTYGKWVFDKLDPSIQNRIKPYRQYYDVGLHGPDILFFHKPLKKNEVSALGYQLHFQESRSFFELAKQKIVESKNPDAALAYIIGFINHFVLDSECHGLINKMVKELPITHSELESEFDAKVMRELQLEPTSTKVTTHIKLRDLDPEIIAPFFGVTPKEVMSSMKTMVHMLNLFVAPSRVKRNSIYRIMKLANKYDEYQGLIINYKENINCKSIVSTLRKKMDVALLDSLQLIPSYVQTLHSETPLSTRYDHTYEGM